MLFQSEFAMNDATDTENGYYISRWAMVSVVCALVALITGCLVALNRLQMAQATIVTLKTGRGIALGIVPPPLRGVSIDRAPRILQPGLGVGKATLVLVFAANCSACKLNWSNWDKVRQHSSSSKPHVLFVSLGAGISRDFLHEHGIDEGSLLTSVDESTLYRYNLRYTPQTILFDSLGRPVGVWTGVLSETDMKEIAARL